MTRRLKALAYAAGFVASMGLAGQVAAEVPESDDPIKIAINDWSSQYVNSYIVGGILERLGYDVEYVQADYFAQFAGLESGDLHMQMEVWETTGKDALEASVATGNTLDMGGTGMKGIEDWWYPLYVKEACPGLPDWTALKDCAKEFATPETAPKGRFLSGAVQWGGHDEERVEALGLDFEVVHAGTEGTLWAEIESAYQRKAPIVAWVWSPHWWPTKYEGEFVEFPAYADACYEDPSWGLNPDKAYDCGRPRGWIKKVAWAGSEQKWPTAYQVLRNFNIDNETIGGLIAKVDLENQDAREVAEDWLDANEGVWRPWTE